MRYRYKRDISEFFDKKTLVVFDIDSVARFDYVSSFMGRKGNKPSFYFDYNEKPINSTVIVPLFMRMINAQFYIDDVDFIASFETPPNQLSKIQNIELDDIFDIENELLRQSFLLRHALRDIGVRILEKDGYESYSLIIKAVQDNYDKYDKILIYTRDKSLYKLVDEKVDIIQPMNSYDLVMENYEQALGVKYNRIDFKMVCLGDKSIGITGLKGIGNVRFQKMCENNQYLTDLELIHQEFKDEQLEKALADYEWLQAREIDYLNTNTQKHSATELKSYLELFNCNHLVDKVL